MPTISHEQRHTAFLAALDVESALAELPILRERALAALAEREQRLRETHARLMALATTAEVPPESGAKRASTEASARTARPRQRSRAVAHQPVGEPAAVAAGVVPAPQVPCANCRCAHSLAQHKASDAVTLVACRTPGCDCRGFALRDVHGWRVLPTQASGVPRGAYVLQLSGEQELLPVMFLHGGRLVDVATGADVLDKARKAGRWPVKDPQGAPYMVLKVVAETLTQLHAQESAPEVEQPAAPAEPPAQEERTEASPPAEAPAAPARDDNAPLPGQLELGVTPPSAEEAQPEPAPTAPPAGAEVEGWRVELAHAAKRLTCVWLVHSATGAKYAATWFGGAVGELVLGHSDKQSPRQQLSTEEAEARRWWREHQETVHLLTQACRQGKVPGLRVALPARGADGPYTYALSDGWALKAWAPSEDEPDATLSLYHRGRDESSEDYRLSDGYLVGASASAALWAEAHEALVREVEDLVSRGFVPELAKKAVRHE